MVPVNFQPVQDCRGSSSMLGLNHLPSSQFLANPEANVRFEDSDSSNGICISGKLKVVLYNHSLWLEFSRQKTEMILNKPGRRMFPCLVYKIYGMNPIAHYRIFLEIVPVDEHRWRYWNGKWCQCEKTENNIRGSQLYIHPDSPNTGAYWMKKEISFETLKVTNNQKATNNGNKIILLQSFRKYQPRLGIEEVWDGEHEIPAPSSFTHSFTFPETEFIAVTSYQNVKVSQLKIKYNHFASGYRKNYRTEESVNMCLASVDSTAMSTTSPEGAISGGSLHKLGEGSHQAKERAPLSNGLLVQAAQPFQGYAYDSTLSSSNLPSLGISGMEHGFLPFTSLPTTHHNSREKAMVPQGNRCPSCSSKSSKNSGRWLQSVPSGSMDTVSRTEEEKQLEEPWTLLSDSNDSGLIDLNPGSKKKCLSPNDSRNEMYAGCKCIQHARCLTSSKFNATMISTENAHGGYTVGLGEGAGQVMDKMPLTPGVLPQVSKKPMDYACASVNGNNNLQPLGRNGMNPGLLPSICSPTMPFGPNQDVVDPAGYWPNFFSANSNMNNGNWLQSLPPLSMDPLMGTQKEMDPEEHNLLTQDGVEDSEREMYPNDSRKNDSWMEPF